MALTLRRKRWLLRGASGSLIALACGAGYLALDPPRLNREAPVQPSPRSSKPSLKIALTPLVVDPESPAWRTRLRRPLYDPPPPPPPRVVEKKLPPLRSKLLGTIIEPGASQAMIGAPGGEVLFKTTGDALGPHDADAVLVEIGAKSVKIARGDEITTLTVE